MPSEPAPHPAPASPPDEAYERLLREGLARVAAGGETPETVYDPRSKLPCPFPWSYLMVYPDGHVQTCCYNSKTLGNLNESTFEEVWNGPAYRSLRRDLLEEKLEQAGCAQCPLYERMATTPLRVLYNRLMLSSATPTQLANGHLIESDVLLGRTAVKGKPAVLALELSEKCNYDCFFCFQKIKNIKLKSERVDEMIRSELPVLRELVLTGGEPLVLRDNIKILESLSQEQADLLALQLYTNGALIPRHLELLRKFKSLLFVISMHSLNEENYKKLMTPHISAKEMQQIVCDLAAELKTRPGWKVHLSVVLMKSNRFEAPELARFAVELGVLIGFFHLHGDYPEENFYDDPALLPDRTAFHASLDEAIAILGADRQVDRAEGIANLEMLKRMTGRPSAAARFTRTLKGAIGSVRRRFLPIVR